MLLHKYEPKSTREIIGNDRQAFEATQWIRNWRKGSGLIVSGPTGSGKTLLVRLLAKEMGYDVVESSADSDRGKQGFAGLIESAKQGFRKKIILVEDTELMETKRYLADLVEQSSSPVVITADDAYDLSVYRTCRVVRMARPGAAAVAKFLRSVCDKEDIEASDILIEKIAESSSGDVRAALIDLEFFTSDIQQRSQAKRINDAVKAIFSGGLAAEGVDTGTLLMWLCENIHTEYRNVDEMAKAYDLLSRADMMAGRIIRRQSWSLEKYILHFLAQFPRSKRIMQGYRQPFRRRANKEALEYISGVAHVSRKKAHEYVPLLQVLEK